MDLEKISGRVARYGYRGRAQFLRDMELIYNNSKQFNGEQSEYTAKAKRLLDFTKGQLYQAAHNDYLPSRSRFCPGPTSRGACLSTADTGPSSNVGIMRLDVASVL